MLFTTYLVSPIASGCTLQVRLVNDLQRVTDSLQSSAAEAVPLVLMHSAQTSSSFVLQSLRYMSQNLGLDNLDVCVIIMLFLGTHTHRFFFCKVFFIVMFAPTALICAKDKILSVLHFHMQEKLFKSLVHRLLLSSTSDCGTDHFNAVVVSSNHPASGEMHNQGH